MISEKIKDVKRLRFQTSDLQTLTIEFTPRRLELSITGGHAILSVSDVENVEKLEEMIEMYLKDMRQK